MKFPSLDLPNRKKNKCKMLNDLFLMSQIMFTDNCWT